MISNSELIDYAKKYKLFDGSICIKCSGAGVISVDGSCFACRCGSKSSMMAKVLSALKEDEIKTKKTRENQSRVAKFSKKLKNNQTSCEKILGKALKEAGIKHRAQKFNFSHDHKYIVDFYIPMSSKKGVVIELDGSSHKNRAAYDHHRTKWLQDNRNVRVVRFKNKEVRNDIKGVIARIKNVIDY